MLLRFSVGNFLSFKNPVEFRMAAGKMTRHNNHIAVVKDGKRILKGGFIFGANAAGKSNLIRAIEFARDSVLDGVSTGACYKRYFRIDEACKSEPGFFQFDIFAGKHFYSYGFAISYQKAEIVEEWLYCIDDGEKRIFERGNDKSGKMKVISDMQFDDPKDKNQFEVYSEAIDNDEMKHKTFLSDMALRGNRDAAIYQSFRDVRNWLTKLCIIYPNSSYNGSLLRRYEKEQLTVERLLKYFDTGVEALSRTEKSFEKVFDDVPSDIMSSLREKYSVNLKEPTERGAISYNGAYYEISIKDGELIATEVVSDHGNPNDLFEYKDESDGTRRLFDLLPIYRLALSGRVIIIDELDRSLHTKATLEFINRFYEETENCNTQLIATTHDSNILDLDILRQDEIWLVERKNDHASVLRPLSYFKPRFDKDVKKEYLVGRYGAVPIFDHLALLEDEDGEQLGE